MKTTTLLLGLLCLAPFIEPSTSAQTTNRFRETFNALFALRPVEASTGASGTATLRWLNSLQGTSALRLQTRGLAPGEFVLEGTGPSGGFTIPFVVDQPRGRITRSRETIEFDPFSVDPTGVERLVVTSADGVPVLEADLTQPGRSRSTLNSRLPLTSTLADQDVLGLMSWQRTFRNGLRLDRFALNASGLPATTPLILSADGTELGTVNTSTRGRLLLRESFSGLNDLSSLLLSDTTGNDMFSVNFQNPSFFQSVP